MSSTWIYFSLLLAGAIAGIILFSLAVFFIRKWRKNTRHLILKDPVDQLNIILDRMEDYIYIKDTKSRFIIANNRFLNTFYLNSVKDVIGKTDLDFYPADMANKYLQDERHIVETGEPLIGEIEKALDEKGEIIYLSTSKFPVFNTRNQVIGIVGIGRDVTRIKIYENNLIEANKQLNDFNQELLSKQEHIFEQSEKLQIQAQELEYANEQLSELVKTRDKFLSVIAHDLKNPVSVLCGFSELLYFRYNSLEEAKKLKYIESILSSSNNLTNLLDNLLQWARMQSGGIRFTPEKINVLSFLAENIHIFTESIVKKEISLKEQFEIDEQCAVFGDRHMLDFVFRNLLTNAIKFTSRNGHILIVVEKEDDKLNISIEDDGIGIDDSYVDKIFDVGQNKSTQGTEGETGTGMGLILAHDFIKKNNGNIWCESAQGKGSKFYFSVPLFRE